MFINSCLAPDLPPEDDEPPIPPIKSDYADDVDPKNAVKRIPFPPRCPYLKPDKWENYGNKDNTPIDYSFMKRLKRNKNEIIALYNFYSANNPAMCFETLNLSSFFKEKAICQLNMMNDASENMQNLKKLRAVDKLDIYSDYFLTENDIKKYKDYYYIIKNDASSNLLEDTELLLKYLNLAIKVKYTYREIFQDLTGIDNPLVYDSIINKTKVYEQGLLSNVGAYEAITALSDLYDNINSRKPIKNDLYQNHPNPFNNSTIITYKLDFPSIVKLIIYNTSGQIVRVLKNERQQEGIYKIEWNGTTTKGQVVSSGVYLYELSTEHGIEKRKMTYIK